jgi:hypothetical protein
MDSEMAACKLECRSEKAQTRLLMSSAFYFTENSEKFKAACKFLQISRKMPRAIWVSAVLANSGQFGSPVANT